MSDSKHPERIARVAGPLGGPGTPPDIDASPYGSIEPVAQGFVDRDGVKIWHAVWGTIGPWIAFAPPLQIVHSEMLKAVVPYLSEHFRVITMDGRGNGRSDRPQGQEHYSFDHSYADVMAVLDAVTSERVALVGISAAAMTVLRLAAEHPERVSHVVVAGGFADSRRDLDERVAKRLAAETEALKNDWPAYIDWFMGVIFSEPHSTKPYEDGVHYAWATTGQTMQWFRNGWLDNDVRELARRVTCPTLVIHGDNDQRVPLAKGEQIHALVPGSRLLRVAGGGHVTAARDPVMFNRALRDFVAGAPRQRTWVRGMNRQRRALFICSPIGLGHVQRDLAIARELRKLQPDLQIDWFTVDPAARYLLQEGEHLHPITARLANESRHFESMAGEHDLQAFFALRTMDEIMSRNFMTFVDLMEAEHYDIVIGDEAWDVDYYYHENPELKRQPYVFLTDFVGCLPMEEGNEREAVLCADRNADDIEHIARYPYLRDAAIFVGNREDVTEQTFGPGLPGIRDWTDRNFCYCGYCLPFNPAALSDTDALRARHSYDSHEKIAIASVGGTATGAHLLHRIADAFPRMKREMPELRLILVTGPRLSTEGFKPQPGLELRAYVHNLYEHLACCDLALVQGGLSTTMELVATRRPFLSFPLQRHFEQCVHVRQRLANYAADHSVDYAATLDPDLLAERALQAMHAPVRYRPVETDGAARAAKRIAQVLDNRWWAR